MNVGNRGALAAATFQPLWIGMCQGVMVDVSFRANLGFAIVNLLFVALILGGAPSLLLR
jgi:hypothetical protein